MSIINHISRDDSMDQVITCQCGAVYRIYTDDGVAGSRSVEQVYCDYCGNELARNFGECEGHLVDDSNVSEKLKMSKKCRDEKVSAYVKKHGYNWNTDEYSQILQEWRKSIK